MEPKILFVAALIGVLIAVFAAFGGLLWATNLAVVVLGILIWLSFWGGPPSAPKPVMAH